MAQEERFRASCAIQLRGASDRRPLVGQLSRAFRVFVIRAWNQRAGQNSDS